MQYTAPHYYNRFQCIAGKCPDTCCAGWQIAIDGESLKRYGGQRGLIGNRLHNEIDWKEKVFRQYGGRCAFLNEENLCDLYLEGGSKLFCRTCRTYPRHIEEFEGLKEISLSLSCPAAARLILGLPEPVRFLKKEGDSDGGDEDYGDFDYFLFTKLEDARDVILRILQNRMAGMDVRMAMVLALSHDLQQRLDKNALSEIDGLLERYLDEKAVGWFTKRLSAYKTDSGNAIERAFSIFDGLEVLKADWKDYLGTIKQTLFHKHPPASDFGMECMKDFDTIWEQLMVYFVYTYFCGAVYDGNAYVKMKFSVTGTLLIREMARSLWIQRERHPKGEIQLFEDLVEAAGRYAREIEHSEPNKNRVMERLDRDELFALDTFFGML